MTCAQHCSAPSIIRLYKQEFKGLLTHENLMHWCVSHKDWLPSVWLPGMQKWQYQFTLLAKILIKQNCVYFCGGLTKNSWPLEHGIELNISLSFFNFFFSFSQHFYLVNLYFGFASFLLYIHILHPPRMFMSHPPMLPDTLVCCGQRSSILSMCDWLSLNHWPPALLGKSNLIELKLNSGDTQQSTVVAKITTYSMKKIIINTTQIWKFRFYCFKAWFHFMMKSADGV